jgi:hypothetical protein
MKSRLVVALALALALASVGGTVSRVVGATHLKPPAAHASLAPRLGAYLGAFEPGTPPDYAPVRGFAKAAGRTPNLIGYYSGWAQPFDMSFATSMRQHGIIPFVQIDPTDASVAAISHGSYDEYLRSYADSVRNFGDAVVIGFGQRHLAVDGGVGPARHRRGQGLVARIQVRDLGRGGWVLLPADGHVRVGVRADHQPGAHVHQRPGPAVGDRGRPGG